MKFFLPLTGLTSQHTISHNSAICVAFFSISVGPLCGAGLLDAARLLLHRSSVRQSLTFMVSVHWQAVMTNPAQQKTAATDSR